MLKQVVWSVMLAVLALTPKASAQPAGPSVRLDKLFERDMLNVGAPSAATAAVEVGHGALCLD
jgi:hypothetical protein